MRFQTRVLAVASLAVLVVAALGCGSASKSPTGVTTTAANAAGTESAVPGFLPAQGSNTVFPPGSQAPNLFDKTRPSRDQSPSLGAANGYAVLAGSTITNTGPTVVIGGVGLSPGSAVTGFPPGIIRGVRHVSNQAAARAKSDLTSAYNELAGRTTAPILVAGNLGGQTLAPGLYKSTSSLAISSGDLTLDAQGNRNAVFVFQIASTLTTTSGRKVILSGGARASNVFWQVGSSATLGTTSTFQGSILADQSISLETGATLNGRALARIGAVTMDANSVTLPN